MFFSGVSVLYFLLAASRHSEQNQAYEKLHENPVLDSSGDNVHGLICGG